MMNRSVKTRDIKGLMNLAEFVIQVEAYNSNINIALIRKAYEFADKAHKDQKRLSGDPFFLHSVQTALILAEQHLDSTTIAAGLLHDVVEDTDVTIKDISREFGEEIAELVEGVTKISEYRAQSVIEAQAENFRKMLLSMAHDIRVILIKLADRLHNMRTLEHVPEEKRRVIAEETYEVYAPLANRFGMARIKWELEDLALKHLNPERYDYIASKTAETQDEREEYVAQIIAPIRKALDNVGISARIHGRPKSINSISQKMEEKQIDFEQIFDLFAIRIIVEDVGDCYAALGQVHQVYRPTGIGFDDYIANPKANGYQSLHTNIVGPRGRVVEVQIRTQQMNRTAEYGISGHWLYKEGKDAPGPADKQYSWLREVLDWQKDMTNPAEFLEYLKIDLFRDEVFVFTPDGELKHLPAGSTPLDFAFAVHTDVGLRCRGAKVNGRLVPLTTRLSSGDEVEILTASNQEPSQDWIKLVHTSRARSKIRRYLKQKGFEQSVDIGKDMLEKTWRKQNLKFPEQDKLLDAAQALSYTSIENMYAAVGRGDVSIASVMSKLFPSIEKAPKESMVKRFLDRARKAKGIRINDVDSLMFRFAKCCQPVPGEKIIGFVTRGRGISIHRIDCEVALKLSEDSERMVDVQWDVDSDDSFLVRIEVVVDDRKNMLRDILDSIATEDLNIRDAEMKSHEGTAQGSLVIEIRNLNQLQRVMSKISKTPGVMSVWRSQGGKEAE